jgi:inner membrane protein
MNPVEHFLISWDVANAFPLERRERAIVTIAGLIPDLDGLGMFAELATRGSRHELLWWTDYHHALTHNLVAAVATTGLAFALARKRRGVTAIGAFVTFHLHLLGDLIGARGPDGYNWPIPYLTPFSQRGWTWDGQWALNAWQNVAITAVGLATAIVLARRRGFSFVEMLSPRADARVVEALRGRGAQG